LRRASGVSHFVFVESNTTGTGAMAVERLLAAGHAVTFLTRSRRKYPFLQAPRRHPELRVADAETNHPERLVDAVRRMQACGPVDALLTFSEFYVEIVAEVAGRCGLRGLHPSAARSCRNKHLTRCALRAAGLAVPDFWMVTSERHARRIAHKVRYPCVVKPPADSSSHGVRMVRDADELVEAYRLLSAWRENVRGQRLDGRVLIEDLIEGPEYSVETISAPGAAAQVIGVTDKHLSDPPHFVELGHDFPSRAEPRVRRALAETTVRALEAVGFDFGPAHTEVRWTAAGPVVVEINARLAGGMIPELVWHATGIDLMGAWFELLLGNGVQLEPTRAYTASIRFVTSSRRGRLAAVSGLAHARSLPHVQEVALSRPMGEPVRPPEDAYDRLGYVIAAGEDGARVERAALEALRAIRLDVEPFAPSLQETAPAALSVG
jgi:biotin carboxylase